MHSNVIWLHILVTTFLPVDFKHVMQSAGGQVKFMITGLNKIPKQKLSKP